MERHNMSEDSILSELQSSSDLFDIHRIFTSHLSAFTPHFKPSVTAVARKPKSKPPDNASVTVRTLAKQFLPFLHRSLSVVPKRLTESPKMAHRSALELLDVYRLCLKCLSVIAPELSGKPHAVAVQKLRYIHCLEHWELYKEAEVEGFAVLESFNPIDRVGAKVIPKKSRSRLIPELNEECVDPEFTILMLEIVVTLVKCAAKRRSKENADYRRVISLVNESESWFKILDGNDHNKVHRFLVSNLQSIILFLISEIKYFDVDLICEFSMVTFKECQKSSVPDQMYKIASKILSYLFSQRDQPSKDIIINILKYVFDFMAAECKVGTEKAIVGFFELVCYCANKTQGSIVSFCNAVAQYFNSLADDCHEGSPFVSSVLRLYATGLLASSANNQSREGNIIDDGSPLNVLLDNMELFHQTLTSLTLLKDQYCNGDKTSISHRKIMPYSSSYWDGLRFLCHSLAEFIYSRRNDIFSGAESAFRLDGLNTAHLGFQQFCDLFFHCLSASERERETSADNCRVICVVAVADLILSFKLNQNKKESTVLVKHVISAEWVPYKRLKYLYVFLYNVAVILKRNRRSKEAIKALKLCSKASWNYVKKFCEMIADDLQKSQADMSENAIADFVKEISDKNAFLLDLLNQENCCKINSVVVESLTCWLAAKNLVAMLPTPASLVKQWVKIEYMRSKNPQLEHGTVLYSLLSSVTGISKLALGELLEEELVAYEEHSYLNPRICHGTRMKIISVLLEDVFVTKDLDFERSRILIEKGRELRAHGLTHLEECIKCLSYAISTLKSSLGVNKRCSSDIHHLLIHAYILHALCIQEAVPNSLFLSSTSEFIQDIHSAIKLSLSPELVHPDDQYDEKSQDTLYLWFIVLDLLLLKGYMGILPGIYDVIFKLFNQKNLPLEKTLTELWKNKRLSHALCVSPINHALIMGFFKDQTELESVEFWKRCVEEMKPLVGLHCVDNEIKRTISDITSHVSLSSNSIFLSSHYCYDVARRMISSGRMVEALSYAKEAHLLRSKLLQQKFEYSVEKMTVTSDENGVVIEKSYYGIKTFKENDGMMIKKPYDDKVFFLTPWNVLSCYLESILQIGIVHEILGNAHESEMLLMWGKSVSQFKGLPLFEVSFSSILGKLYQKQKLWGLAEKELSLAMKILVDNKEVVSCGKCACMLEVCLTQRLGDLFLSSSCSNGKSISTNGLLNAKSLYQSTLDKLNHHEWRIFKFIPEKASVEQDQFVETSSSECLLEANNSILEDRFVAKTISKKSRRTKQPNCVSQRQNVATVQNRRITRSAYRSLQNINENLTSETSTGPTVGFVPECASTSAPHCENDMASFVDFHNGFTSLCKNMRCWHCVHLEAVNSGSLSTFIYTKWELVYKHLLLKLSISIGKISGLCCNLHDTHELLLQSICILYNTNSSCSKYSSSSLIFLIESMGQHFPGDVLAVERAALLYYICWFTLKSYTYQSTSRKNCCEFSCIGMEMIISWLKLAFILCHEVPSLSQKVSRLLAILYILSTSVTTLSLPPSNQVSESQWGSFFHQASLGSHLNQQVLSDMLRKQQTTITLDSEDSLVPNSGSIMFDVLNSVSFQSKSCKDLEEFIIRFFQGLPASPVICISLVSGADSDLLRDLLSFSPAIQAWILLSHISSENQHIILLPVCTKLEASNEESSSNSMVFDCKDFVKKWHCPWVSSVIDDIAPVFRHVLEGNYYSSSEYFLDYIKENTALWWLQRNRLDGCLSRFLQDLEELWLGTWKYLLLGKWPDHSHLESSLKNISEDERHLLELVASKKCYVSVRLEASSKTCSDFEQVIGLIFKTMLDTSHKNQVEFCRQPIILVLDFDLQMLPWENLPILRNQEVYRMPSVRSIFSTLDKCRQSQQLSETTFPAFPSIDPLDSFYLLNPDGDLSRTQDEFQDWFKDQNIKGKTGTVPTIEELTLALKNHDLFIYFGHGSGTQYIPVHEIEKLDGCAASLLLGCSSGSLYLKGSYMPQGAPISYLLAGSPVIVANLWEVTDKDIDRFGKAMLNAWLRERSVATSVCSECEVNSHGHESTCNHRPRIGSFMAKAREACTLQYLIGASPVCYGVPTGIIKRKDV